MLRHISMCSERVLKLLGTPKPDLRANFGPRYECSPQSCFDKTEDGEEAGTEHSMTRG